MTQDPASKAPAPVPNALDRVGGVLDLLESRILFPIATTLLLFGAGLMLYEAAGRSFFSHSTPWAEEMVRYVTIWGIFLVFGFASRRGHFIRTELLLPYLPHWLRRVFDWTNCLGGLLFSSVLLWAGWMQTVHLHRLGLSAEALPVNMWLVKSALVIGAASLFAYFLYVLVRVIRGQESYPAHEGEEHAVD